MDPIVKFVEKLLPLTPQFPVSAAAYDVRVHRELCHFPLPVTGTEAGSSSPVEADGRPNGRVANEVCHTKRRTNTDELARIT